MQQRQRQGLSPWIFITLSINAHEALAKALTLPCASVLDVGCGDGYHAQRFKEAGKKVLTVSLCNSANFTGDYLDINLPQFDLIWASHVLEHQTNPGLFLKKCLYDLTPGGWLCVTVPPAKDELVGGHVTIWNESILVYQLVLAGFNCRDIMIKRYGYNISAIVRKSPISLPDLKMDYGDIELLETYLPSGIRHGDIIGDLNW